jgi:putative phosphoribosyl transferase
MLFRDEDEDVELLPFANRAEAGRMLGAKLAAAYSGRGDVVVLGLSRSGVPVAFQVAQVLNAPLDVLVVRKLGIPWERELAMGAIASGEVQVLDLSSVKQLRVPDEDIQDVVAVERNELARQKRLYRGNRPPLPVAGKTVILVSSCIS